MADTMLQEMALLLEDSGLGTRGEAVFIDKMPDKPDNAICIFEYPGMPPIRGMGPGVAQVGRHNIQVRVRNVSPLDARVISMACWMVLDAVLAEDVDGSHYLRIEAGQMPFPLPDDPMDRALVACNYEVWREP